MNTPKTPQTKIHHGKNIKRFRDMLGIKQDTLAIDLGISQQAISQLEQKETIEQELLEKIATTLKVPVDAIKKFTEEAALNIILNTYNSQDNATPITAPSAINFNPIEKLIEALEENKKLYERLLQSEREKIEILQAHNLRPS